jgi:LytS/YehU family sensor histidine kinase
MDLIEVILYIIWSIIEIFVDGYFGYSYNEQVIKHNWKTILAVLFGIALGLLVGCISYLIWPHHIISNKSLQIVNMLIAPILSGFFGGWLAYRKAKKNQEEKAITHFFIAGIVSFATLAARYVLLAQ